MSHTEGYRTPGTDDWQPQVPAPPTITFVSTTTESCPETEASLGDMSPGGSSN